jgi:hypothetical protein
VWQSPRLPRKSGRLEKNFKSLAGTEARP